MVINLILALIFTFIAHTSIIRWSDNVTYNILLLLNIPMGFLLCSMIGIVLESIQIIINTEQTPIKLGRL